MNWVLVLILNLVFLGVQSNLQKINCYQCLCESKTPNCKPDPQEACSGRVCGPYKITRDYWIDAGRPLLNWRTCTIQKYCSTVSVDRYMLRYGKDCNGNGVIDCDDYWTIHSYGLLYCNEKSANVKNSTRYLDCKVRLNVTLDSLQDINGFGVDTAYRVKQN